MKRPVHLSIGRIVLPAAMRGQERSFGDALTTALQTGAAPTQPAQGTDTKAARAADAIHQRIAERSGDG
ncbi:hypothetical protein [Tateyamaria sp. SN3-11]|uniref:hypothetical protein n=1 Tax=Tateyamaria sp. SN3-11 TaxID=3092147 RepID=UPI0039E976AE